LWGGDGVGDRLGERERAAPPPFWPVKRNHGHLLHTCMFRRCANRNCRFAPNPIRAAKNSLASLRHRTTFPPSRSPLMAHARYPIAAHYGVPDRPIIHSRPIPSQQGSESPTSHAPTPNPHLPRNPQLPPRAFDEWLKEFKKKHLHTCAASRCEVPLR
jgi:hypothetical protein